MMKKTILGIIISILTLVFILLASTLIVSKSKFIYYYFVDNFYTINQEELTQEDVFENYSYITDYILGDTDSATFQLPSLKYSQDGAVHFYEVRNLFTLAKICTFMSFVLLIFLVLIYRLKFENWHFLKLSGLTLILVPILSATIISVNFSFFFTVFHKIFFNNDKWLFDPSTDPIINILPEQFFALCAGLIILLTLVGGGVLILSYRILSTTRKNKNHEILIDDNLKGIRS